MSSHPQTQIYVVDGDDAEREALTACLVGLSAQVSEFKQAADVLDAVATEVPDLVLSEVRLPDASGYGLCRLLREDVRLEHLAVVLVSRWSSEMDRILCFESGADDFVARPFFQRELGSRVAAVLRRRAQQASDSRRQPDATPPVTAAPVIATGSVRLAGARVDLTPKEAAILASLGASDGTVRTRRQLIESIWGDDATLNDRCIDSHVKSLRRKLGRAGRCIETVRGVGYRFSRHPDLDLSADR